MLGLVRCEEVEVKDKSRWCYSLCEGIEPTALISQKFSSSEGDTRSRNVSRTLARD